MNNLFPKKKAFIPLRIIVILLLLFTMTGCKKNTELENYKANMIQFFENVKIFDSSINAIDPNSETAVSDLLALLDSMDTSFAQMASLEVPDGFPGVEELADEASSCMSEAVSYYHQAYEGEYDASLEDLARQKYERANVMLQYIVSIFRGDVPEELYTYDEGTEETPEGTDPVEE
ncbi:MAG: hypothetical protein K2H52_11445 [Lachnospiraceae bacterium]|nr:hypothetical protein [Lachnospiraceae bacterium]MDE7285809.1 hypothetical protein [Lachnospiraceae bacterium]